jgi:hypothetical protein
VTTRSMGVASRILMASVALAAVNTTIPRQRDFSGELPALPGRHLPPGLQSLRSEEFIARLIPVWSHPPDGQFYRAHRSSAGKLSTLIVP